MIILGFDLDTVKMLMSIFVRFHSSIRCVRAAHAHLASQDTDRSGTIGFNGKYSLPTPDGRRRRVPMC